MRVSRCRPRSRLRAGMRHEKPEHLRSGVRAARIRVRPFRAAARPCMGGAVHHPMLGEDRALAAATMHVAGVAVSACGAALFRVYVTRGANAGCDHVGAVARVHGVIRVSVEHDGRHA